MHEAMMGYVNSSLKDADILLFITDPYESEMNHKETLAKIQKLKIPVFCLINKIDLVDQKIVEERMVYWKQQLPNSEMIPISALHVFNLEKLWSSILDLLPQSPPYYDKEEISDRPVRFFVSEIIREKIFEMCKKEIPYSSQVEIDTYLDEGGLIRIRALIIVERDSQRGIIIGKGGEMLKRIGTMARKDLEKFLDKKVFLESYVKVDKDWRTSDSKLKKYGYGQ
jgi:GTP-binding protein Era